MPSTGVASAEGAGGCKIRAGMLSGGDAISSMAFRGSQPRTGLSAKNVLRTAVCVCVCATSLGNSCVVSYRMTLHLYFLPLLSAKLLVDCSVR